MIPEDFEADYIDASHYLVRSDNVILAVSISLGDREEPTATKAARGGGAGDEGDPARYLVARD